MSDHVTPATDNPHEDTPPQARGDEPAAPWEPLRLGARSGLYDVPWQWWDNGQDGRDR